jgi:transposase
MPNISACVFFNQAILWRKIKSFFYSSDFHLSVLKAYQEGTSTQQERADLFPMAISMVKCILKRDQNTGLVLFNKNGAERPRRVDDKGCPLIRDDVPKNPSVTRKALQTFYGQQRTIHLSLVTHLQVSHYLEEQERDDAPFHRSVSLSR